MVVSINHVQQVLKVYGENNKVNAAAKTERISKRDEIEFSSEGQLIQKAQDAIKNLPEIRGEKVAILKQSVKSGNYTINGEEVMKKMLGLSSVDTIV